MLSRFAARPLHKICGKKSRFSWNEDCGVAFTNLKRTLTSAPILAYLCDGGRFILDTIASDIAVGAVLLQEQNEVVIAYISKAINKHEQSYCVTRKELLAGCYNSLTKLPFLLVWSRYLAKDRQCCCQMDA